VACGGIAERPCPGGYDCVDAKGDRCSPLCGGADCGGAWDVGLFAATDGDTVVWGTSDTGDTVVWGTADGDTVVWGTSDDGDTVVWGTSCMDVSCTPVIWNR